MMAVTSFALLGAQKVETTPKETYQAFHQALKIMDLKGIQAWWLPDETIIGDERKVTDKIIQMRQIIPPEIEILDEEIVGKNAFLKVVGSYPNGGRSKGTIYLVKTVDRWKVKQEAWGLIELPKIPVPKGDGVIEGIVTLPPVEDKGDLYVFAILENTFFPAGYAKIPKEQVVWKAIPYRVTELPPGTYWVYAYWDTAPPHMDPEKEDFAIFTGDYAGEFLTTVTLLKGETRGRVDFACNRNLKAKDEENYGSTYELVDLGLSLGEGGKPVFLLSIRNTGREPVKTVSLLCKINGKELDYTASAPGTLILPREVRSFDITTCYESYLLFSETVWTEENLSKKELRMEIVSRDNGFRLTKELVIQ